MTKNTLYNPKLFSQEHWNEAISSLEIKRITKTFQIIPKKISTLIDIGCGDGRLTNYIMKNISDVKIFGLDYNLPGLKNLETNSINASSGDMPVKDTSIDCVVCSEVLEHLPDDLLEKTIEELIRVSKKFIIVTVPYKEQLAVRYKRCDRCGHIFHMYGHLHCFDKESILSRFENFKILNIEIIDPNSIRYYSPFLLKIKQNIFNSWAWTSNMICPNCNFKYSNKRKINLIEYFFSALNRLFNLKKTRGGWLLISFQLSD